MEKFKDGISLVIPIYNEEVLLQNALEECIEYMENNFEDFEIIIIDDGSKDQSLNILNAKFSDNPKIKIESNFINLNQGITVQRGFKIAKKKWVTFNGIDFPLSISELASSLINYSDEVDIIVFERKKYSGATQWRLITSNVNIVIRKILFPKLTKNFKDLNFTQIYRNEVVNNIMPLAKSPAFTTPEMIFRARLKKYRIIAIDSAFQERKHGKGSLGKLHDILWTIYDMVRFRYLLWVGLNTHGKV